MSASGLEPHVELAVLFGNAKPIGPDTGRSFHIKIPATKKRIRVGAGDCAANEGRAKYKSNFKSHDRQFIRLDDQCETETPSDSSNVRWKHSG